MKNRVGSLVLYLQCTNDRLGSNSKLNWYNNQYAVNLTLHIIDKEVNRDYRKFPYFQNN